MTLCKCGCGAEIIIKPHHKYIGIPKYIRGHHCNNIKQNKKYMEISQLKIFCKCNCGEEIIIKKYHIWYGIPKYIRGHGNRNKHYSEETRQKMRKPKSKEHKQRLSEVGMGKKQSEEQKRKHSECMRGENNPSWHNGISFEPYCYKFNEPKKEEIRERDGRICQECSKTEKENIKKLTCHHIHYDKPNCNADLISLCISCNSKANFNRSYWEEHFMKKLKERNLIKEK